VQAQLARMMRRPFRRQNGSTVAFDLSVEDHCPCGSKRRMRSCCFKNGVLRKSAATVTPNPPKTGRSIVGCYAAPLQDCDGKLSKEHYVSKAILEKLDARLLASGMPGGSRVAQHPLIPSTNLGHVRPSALAMHILCERHNNCLSPLDSEVTRLFVALDEISDEFKRYPTEERNRVSLFNGHDIERWLLKVCAAMTTFGDRIPTDPPTTFDLPVPWLETLFGLKPFEAEQGLYAPRTIGKEYETQGGVSLGYIGREGRLVGASLELAGALFNLVMTPVAGSRHFLTDDHAYRPFEFHETDGVSEKSICFSWDGPYDGGTITRTVRDSL
jgi:hypothetical protein